MYGSGGRSVVSQPERSATVLMWEHPVGPASADTASRTCRHVALATLEQLRCRDVFMAFVTKDPPFDAGREAPVHLLRLSGPIHGIQPKNVRTKCARQKSMAHFAPIGHHHLHVFATTCGQLLLPAVAFRAFDSR
jgi:hypothetical protein